MGPIHASVCLPRRPLAAAAVSAALAVAGCGGDGDAGGGAAKPPAGAEVTFRAQDGVELHGTLRAAARPGAPAVVLAHQYGGDRHDFDDLVGPLRAAGFATLAYDARDQGGDDQDAYFAKLQRDIAGAAAFLAGRREADRRRLGLVGASIGASSAVLAMGTAAGRAFDGAVALSPRAGEQVRPPGSRPHDVLYVADDAEIAAARELAAATRGTRTLEIPGGGHGVSLLSSARVRDALTGWLRERLR
jgi:dienelactone hydrolase